MLWPAIAACIAILLPVVICISAYRRIFKYFRSRGRETTGFYGYFLSRFPALSEHTFTCPSGEHDLACVRLQYSQTPKALIVMVHGMGWNTEHYFPQAEYFARAGYSVVLFDGTGIGRSGGDCVRGIPQHVLDTAAVLDYVAKQPELSALPLMLYGHSWGAYAANSVPCAGNYPIRAIVSVSGYIEPSGALKSAIRTRYGRIAAEVLIRIILHYQRNTFGRQVEQYTSLRGLTKAGCPALILHSRKDKDLPFDETFAVMERQLSGSGHIRFMAFDGDNHNLGVPGDINKQRRQLQRVIRKSADSDGSLLKKLWDMQLLIDEQVLRILVDFYDKSPGE